MTLIHLEIKYSSLDEILWNTTNVFSFPFNFYQAALISSILSTTQTEIHQQILRFFKKKLNKNKLNILEFRTQDLWGKA